MKVSNQKMETHFFHAQNSLKMGANPFFVASDTGISSFFVLPYGGRRENIMDKFFGLDNPAKLDKDTALLTTTHDDVEKNIICGILEEESIPFLAKDRGAGEAVRVVTGYSMYGCDIFVPIELLEKANSLLEDYRNGEPIFDEDEIVEEET